MTDTVGRKIFGFEVQSFTAISALVLSIIVFMWNVIGAIVSGLEEPELEMLPINGVFYHIAGDHYFAVGANMSYRNSGGKNTRGWIHNERVTVVNDGTPTECYVFWYSNFVEFNPYDEPFINFIEAAGHFDVPGNSIVKHETHFRPRRSSAVSSVCDNQS